jgi:poly-gamma-glutamate capsule biosynthesis protein CapA/YwtB (metallophosphatase superfamily)
LQFFVGEKMHRIGWLRCSSFLLLFVFLFTACTSYTSFENDTQDIANTKTLITQTEQRITPSRTWLSNQIASATVSSTPSPTQPQITTFLFTGIIVPARCVQAGIDERGDPYYLYDHVREIISRADLSIGTLNATISDSTRHEGCVKSWELVGGADNADALRDAGFDLMGMATNHIKDCGFPSCGDRAFLDTLDNINRVGILPVGAGNNLDEALQPVVVEVNGTRFGFVSLGEVFVSERIFADYNKPGIARLTENNLRASIDTTKQMADVVIVMLHSGPEDFMDPSSTQRKWARVSVEAGADLIVMNHAHVIQPYQVIDGVMVFYGLGNFVFDQTWARDHQQSVMLLVEFQGENLISFRFIPTVVDRDGTVHLADDEEVKEILERIDEASQKLE